MFKLTCTATFVRLTAFSALLAAGWDALAQTNGAAESLAFVVRASGKFPLAAEKFGDLTLSRVAPDRPGEGIGFAQAGVKQTSAPARIGPDPNMPYFTVRFALPIPPEDATNAIDGALAGIDPAVFTHNHSPGFEILPNGDALA